MDELISIVVPVYNMGGSLEKCVLSILSQDYQNIEIVLVDDGSKDNSLEVCLKMKELDSRVSVFHTENHGSGPARNYGISQAKGKYIYFPDADDYLVPDAISKMVAATEDGKYDLVVFGFNILNDRGDIIRVKTYEQSHKSGSELRSDYSESMVAEGRYGIQGAPWNKLFNLSIIKAHEISYPPLRRHQDEGFIARYMCYVENVHFIGDVLYTHYANSLQGVWDKYPINYIDVAMGLFEERKSNILQWNKEDHITHALVYKEYICCVIKSLELSFSSKHGFDQNQRLNWQRTIIEKSNINNMAVPVVLGRYQKIVMFLIKLRAYRLCDCLMKKKINIQIKKEM